MRVLVAIACVWFIIFAIPFVIYGSSSVFLDLKPPAGPAWRFLLGVAVTKSGTAAGFVVLFLLCRNALRGRWLLYAAIWFVMFAVSEIGDTLNAGYSVVEAVLGIASEAIYAPLSALTVKRLLAASGG